MEAKNMVLVYRARGRRKEVPLVEVEKAVQQWASVSEWPLWFARNIVTWRLVRGVHWQSCR